MTSRFPGVNMVCFGRRRAGVSSNTGRAANLNTMQNARIGANWGYDTANMTSKELHNASTQRVL